MRKILSRDALSFNLKQIRAFLRGQELVAVVKANAYGHGVGTIAPWLQAEGVGYFGVAAVAEGVALRQMGISGQIIILSALFPEDISLVLAHRLVPTVATCEVAHALVAAAEARRVRVPVHLKVDTGMGRCGAWAEELSSLVQILQESAWIDVEGFYSHWSTSEDENSSYADGQEKVFLQALARVRAQGLNPRWVHMANSAGVVLRDLSSFSMVRVGCLLYGAYPASNVVSRIALQPVMTWKASVVQVKTTPIAMPVSYGGSATVSASTRLAIVNAGYGHGLFRALGNRGKVLIGGQKRPIIGAVCMDLIIIQLEDKDNVRVGDDVVLLGVQESQAITSLDMAQAVGTISYEVLCRASQMLMAEVAPMKESGRMNLVRDTGVVS